MTVRSYRDLIAWQKAMDLRRGRVPAHRRAAPARGVRPEFPLRRAAVSIPSNIAEGQGRGATKEYVRFLRISPRSVQELETQLILAERLGFLTAERLDPILMRLGRGVSCPA